jgi:hypothetical protein
MGFVAEFDKDRNFAVVNVRSFVDVQVGLFKHAREVLPHSEVLVVGRDVSGEMMVRRVGLNGDSGICEDDEDLDCKFSEVHLHEDTSILFYFCYACCCFRYCCCRQ